MERLPASLGWRQLHAQPVGPSFGSDVGGVWTSNPEDAFGG